MRKPRILPIISVLLLVSLCLGVGYQVWYLRNVGRQVEESVAAIAESLDPSLFESLLAIAGNGQADPADGAPTLIQPGTGDLAQDLLGALGGLQADADSTGTAGALSDVAELLSGALGQAGGGSFDGIPGPPRRLPTPATERNAALSSPPVDVFEEGDRYRLFVDAPGADPSSIKAHAVGRELSVVGRRKLNDEHGTPLEQERPTGPFMRRVPLPGPVDPDSVETAYADGVVVVTVKKE